ncbi:Pentatricopeptide repeat-containing protein [Forsythia ovata]|uniref:Pentatricopeptide repeat-containing protein n=1 Tax=Forsythia ovata TaxID=205694 RepID=A0ABD1T3I0_9LAMI
MVVLRTKIFIHQFSCHLTIKIAARKIHDHHHQTLIDQILFLLRKCKSTQTVRQIHAQILINSIHKPNFLLSKLILLKDFEYSTLFFSQIPNVNDYAFNIMIRGLTTTWQKFNLALEYYGKMKSLGVKPDNFTYPFVFISCGNLLALKTGRLAHSEVVRNGLCSDFHVVHSLITMYSAVWPGGFCAETVR